MMIRCYYSPKIIAILVAMILTGAARSVGVKLFYQMGFVNPLFVTLLYLLGHAMALLVYGISLYLEERSSNKCTSGSGNHKNNYRSSHHNTLNSMISKSIHRTSLHDVLGALQLESSSATALSVDKDDNAPIINYNKDGMPMVVSFWGMLPMGEFPRGRITTTPNGTQIEMIMDNPQAATTTFMNSHNNHHNTHNTYNHHNGSSTTNTQATVWGSIAGLNDESKRAVQWIHAIPWYGRPIIPGLCNLFKSALRWASLVHINASVAEILISGLELVFSVLAARLIRKRRVTPVRWIGVSLVLLGIIWVGLTDLGTQTQTKQTSSSSSSTMTGLMLIVAQSIMSAIQDIAEEIFMDESNFPATLLLGMEGLLGFGIGVILYIPTAPLLNEDPNLAWQQFISSFAIWGYGVFLVLLFLINGIANILTTCATSSMTRNVWKNIRTVLVWVLALLIFYIAAAATSSSTTTSITTTPSIGNTLGERWETPKSFITLLGFGIMLFGIHTYYRITPSSNNKPNSTSASSSRHERYDEIILDQVDSLQDHHHHHHHPPQQQPQDDNNNNNQALTTTMLHHLEPVPSNLQTMGSMTTELHDNTIRHRSLTPSPKFELHTTGAATRGGRLQPP